MERNDKISLEQLMFYVNNVAGYQYSDALKLLNNLSFNDSLDLVLKNSLVVPGKKVSLNDYVIEADSDNDRLWFRKSDNSTLIGDSPTDLTTITHAKDGTRLVLDATTSALYNSGVWKIGENAITKISDTVQIA